MGLAPYGEPKYAQKILDAIVDLKSDGSFRLDQKYFDYCTGLTMTNGAFSRLFGQPVRDPASELLTQFHMPASTWWSRGRPERSFGYRFTRSSPILAVACNARGDAHDQFRTTIHGQGVR